MLPLKQNRRHWLIKTALLSVHYGSGQLDGISFVVRKHKISGNSSFLIGKHPVVGVSSDGLPGSFSRANNWVFLQSVKNLGKATDVMF